MSPGNDTRTFRILGISICSGDVLNSYFLRNLWALLGAAPPESQLYCVDDLVCIGEPPRGMAVLNGSAAPRGFIALWVDDLEAARSSLEHRGISTHDGSPCVGRQTSGFRVALAQTALGVDVNVRIDQLPDEYAVLRQDG